jgi:DNA mismatch repair protein MutH
LKNELYEAVKADYDLVRCILLNKNKGFESLTGKMGVYIQPRTEGAGHGSISRAFYARPKFLAEFRELE